MDALNPRIALVLLAILLNGCAPAPEPPAQAPVQPPTLTPVPPAAPLTVTAQATGDPAACDLTSSLFVSSWLGNHKINDVGTKECDYIITFRNMHHTETIVPLVFQQDIDAFKGTDETRWQALPPIAPGARYEWQGFLYLVNDPRASAPMARIPKSVVALKLDPACTPLQTNPAYLQTRAQAMEQPCASDLLLWPDFLPATVPGPDD